MAVRYYLRWVLSECSDATLRATASVTNYATLISKLDRWRRRDEILVVNFNYDTLFDHAFRSQLAVESREPDANVDGATGWHHIKVHGSCDWAQGIEGDVPVPLGQVGASSKDVIRAASNIRPMDHFASWDWGAPGPSERSSFPSGQHKGLPAMPAIAIPLRSKSGFVCPSRHVEILRRQLPSVSAIISIGWGGQDQHFLNELRESGLRAPHVLVITDTQTGGMTVQNALVGAELTTGCELFNRATRNRDNSISNSGPFTRLLRSDVLDEFLGRLKSSSS
jgi:hypothetical protein